MAPTWDLHCRLAIRKKVLISCTKFNVVVGITKEMHVMLPQRRRLQRLQSLAQRCEVDASPVSELLHFYQEETTLIAIQSL